MPIQRVPDTDQSYYLIAFDADGRERSDDPDGSMSRRVLDVADKELSTDVFLFCHGWQGDLLSATRDYGRWLGAALECSGDLGLLREARTPNFRPLFVGLHWPSLPWGDEEFPSPAATPFATARPSVEELVDRYAGRTADTPAARQALHTILAAAREQPNPATLPEAVRAAYVVLDRETNLGSQGEGAAPGADREPFDPQQRYQSARDEAAVPFGPPGSGGAEDLLLAPLRQLSFWMMKDRACRLGEAGGHALLRALQAIRPDLRLHLMGHSFGCIVVSAAVAGPPGSSGLERPVQSLVLVQGALSLWSYCSDIPSGSGRAGYFCPLVAGRRVEGPIVTTRSIFDRAVGRWYPLGAGSSGQVGFAPGDLPRYGGVGTFGLRGPGLDIIDGKLLPLDRQYNFRSGRVYNLESSDAIRAGTGPSGAHGDIAHPEIGHALWSAALPVNPYVGPRPFWTGKSLYGRDREALQLFDLLVADRVVLLHSPSGAGKTSLIRAALVPRLEKPITLTPRPRRRFRVLPVLSVGKETPPEVAKSVRRANRYLLSALQSLEEGLGVKPTPPQQLAETSLADRLRKEADAAEAVAEKCVVIFDQFEEILTHDPTDVGRKRAFFREVGRVLRDRRLWALFSMREDYVAGLEPYLALLPGRLTRTFRLDLLDETAALEAICKPAQEAAVQFDEAAAKKLIEDLSQVRVQLPGRARPTRKRGPYVEPVQLQVVCQVLWDKPRPDPGRITERDIVDFGNVDKILEDYYDQKVAEAGRLAGNEEHLRRWISRWLIAERGLRNQVLMVHPSTHQLDNRFLRPLIDAHLLRQEARQGRMWLEVAHDRLVGPIRRSNVSRSRKKNTFQLQAALWHSHGRPRDLLVGREVLREGERWAEEHPAEVTEIDRQYLQASREARRESQRGQGTGSGGPLGWEVRIAPQAAPDWKKESPFPDVATAGWGVIFAHGADPAVHDALQPLLDHRRQQAGQLYKEFTGGAAYRPGETHWQFLARHGAGLGPAPPDVMPYFLLIVGDPESIPFLVQYQLDVPYAVGRLSFETPQEYANYARTVIEAERAVPLPGIRSAVFFGPQHLEDRATQITANELVLPLADQVAQEAHGWQVARVVREQATKATLRELLGGDQTPALLFLAAHGVAWPNGHPLQVSHQGALVCQDFPGVERAGVYESLRPEWYFAGHDVAPEARLRGQVAFLFADYSAGTPRLEDFPGTLAQPPPPIAPNAFVARLPQRLLGHAGGGALAVLGHVERPLFYSFLLSESGGRNLGHFVSTFRRLMAGCPVGWAMDAFNVRYVEQAVRLSGEIDSRLGRGMDDPDLFRLVRAMRDARNYIVLGDPAVRLPAPQPFP